MEHAQHGDPPKVIVISGPNGAGKSTGAPELLQGALAVSEFVNADVIARGLSAFDPERVAMQAGRVMLERLDELVRQRTSFAFETTLASRTFAHWISELKKTGYLFHLIYLWLPSAEMAVSRVAQRVQQKGHHVPDDIVRRRYLRGLNNFFQLYKPISTSWRMYYSIALTGPSLIAEGGLLGTENVVDKELWASVKTAAGYEAP
jgi:predicted ABC-type ATPase